MNTAFRLWLSSNYITSRVKSVLFSCTKILFSCKEMTEPDITYPDVTTPASFDVSTPASSDVSTPTSSELDKYRLRLIQAHVKTEEDLNKMTVQDIKKLYLKHEQSVIDKMSKQVFKLCVKTYSKSISNVIPIDNAEDLNNNLTNDVFINAAVNAYFPAIYYTYGAYLAPFSMLATTASHVDYQKLKEKSKKLLSFKNGSKNESNEKETETERDTEHTN